MREVDNIRSLASNLSGEEEGTLSIATTHTQARYVLPEIIREFRESYPKVNLELHQGTSEQIAELVAGNQVDFAIATGAQNLFPGLVLLPSYHWNRIVLVPKNHPLAAEKDKLGCEEGPGAVVWDIDNFNLVRYSTALAKERWDSDFTACGFTPLNLSAEAVQVTAATPGVNCRS